MNTPRCVSCCKPQATRSRPQNSERYAGEAETLLIMMQQHNVKEEHVLYPMCDQRLSIEADALVSHIQACLAQS